MISARSSSVFVLFEWGGLFLMSGTMIASGAEGMLSRREQQSANRPLVGARRDGRGWARG